MLLVNLDRVSEIVNFIESKGGKEVARGWGKAEMRNYSSVSIRSQGKQDGATPEICCTTSCLQSTI